MKLISIIYWSPTVVKGAKLVRSPKYPYPVEMYHSITYDKGNISRVTLPNFYIYICAAMTRS